MMGLGLAIALLEDASETGLLEEDASETRLDIDEVQVLTNTVAQLRSTQRPAFGALDAVPQGVSDAGVGTCGGLFPFKVRGSGKRKTGGARQRLNHLSLATPALFSETLKIGL